MRRKNKKTLIMKDSLEALGFGILFGILFILGLLFI